MLALVSFLVGVLGGFVGLALGTMRLPALIFIGVSPTTAAGTNILVSTLSAIVGGYLHIRERRVNWRIVALMGGPAVVGSFTGGFVSSSSVPEGALILVAGIFVSWQSVEFLMRLRQVPNNGPATSTCARPADGPLFTPGRGVTEAAIGLVVGLVGGAVGLILGSVRLPLIIRVLRVDPRVAVGSNLAIGSFMGAFGFIGPRNPGRSGPWYPYSYGIIRHGGYIYWSTTHRPGHSQHADDYDERCPPGCWSSADARWRDPVDRIDGGMKPV